ncbi:hypothetical protein [Halomicrococcus gelatinilyticus]|uniref:hypothetical protein n=1 Tax=Halomicrococcus gelatinilyticus TaxID=1702103 RepID=UPI002E10844D
MDGRAIALAVLLYALVEPLALLAHELAHAAAVLAFTDGDAAVVVGSDDGWRWQRGRLSVTVDPTTTAALWYGVFRCETFPDRTWQAVAVPLAGPAATLVVFLGVTALITVASGAVQFALYGLFWAELSRLIATLVPIQYPSWWGQYAGKPSDGRRAMAALTAAGDPST